MNQPTQFVVHDFKCLDSALFCPSDYSALKFGSDIIAEKFGQEMAFKFYSEHRDLLIADRCVIVPSAFNVVEIAATILARHFMNGLNDLLTREGHRMVEWTTMHRTMSYIADYSFLAKDERQKLLEADKLYINRDFIADKVLLFVDDVTITGTHEDKIVRFMADLGLINPMIFCYYAATRARRRRSRRSSISPASPPSRTTSSWWRSRTTIWWCAPSASCWTGRSPTSRWRCATCRATSSRSSTMPVWRRNTTRSTATASGSS
jgi:hypothetical protein